MPNHTTGMTANAMAALRLLRMADLQQLTIPGQNKRPREGLVFAHQKPKGFEFATADQIFRWESENPEQWLLRTGRVQVDDREMFLTVVDADCPEAVKLCDETLPQTPWTVETPHGRHYYYISPDLKTQRIMGGLDRKAGPNAYVVAPGNADYLPSLDWGHGWPTELDFRQWMVLEDAWLASGLVGVTDSRHHQSSGKRGSSGPRPGAARWRLMDQRCKVQADPETHHSADGTPFEMTPHHICAGRRNAYLRSVVMRFLMRCRRKDGYHATRARVWNYSVKVNANNFKNHRLSLSEVSSIVTKAMADVREQWSPEAFKESQASKGRIGAYRRGEMRRREAARRNPRICADRLVGNSVKNVASAFGLSTRHISRIAPLRGPRRIAPPEPPDRRDGGAEGKATSHF